MIDTRHCLGIAADHLVSLPGMDFRMHPHTLSAFVQLQKAAAAAGFNLQVVSAWRSFDRQLSIWNRKARGELPLYDEAGLLLQTADLSPEKLLQKILLWSALPGTSRHHWGTDIDVYDAAAVPANYDVQLSLDEISDNGPFGALHRWLDHCIAHDQSFGFFRPYIQGRGAVQPERWHLSHRPTAQQFQRLFDPEALKSLLLASSIELKEVILDQLPDILQSRVFAYWE